MAEVIKDSLTYAAASVFTMSAVRLDASAATLNPPMGDNSSLYVTIAVVAMAVAGAVILAVLIISAKNRKK